MRSNATLKTMPAMMLEHIAIWTNQIEALKDYYQTYYDGRPNDLYINREKGFRSYFLTFGSGARLELMSKDGIPENKNDRVGAQHLGLIHLAFGVETMEEVDQIASELQAHGFPILSGPRKTGDGYYEFETLDPDNNRVEVSAVYRS